MTPAAVADAWRAALAAWGADAEGACIEVSVYMHRELRRRGIDAQLVRYEMPRDGGHWTVRALGQEFDPTIGLWRPRPPRGVVAGALHVVGPRSPHRHWDEDGSVNAADAYAICSVDLHDGLAGYLRSR